MKDQAPRHERIRFRGAEIVDFASLPSAGGRRVRAARPWRARRAVTIAGLASALAVSLVLLAAVAVYLLGVSGIGREQLRMRAESAIERLAGRDVAVAIESARISLDGSRILGLEVNGVSLTAADGGLRVADVATMRFGLRLLPLLHGEVELGNMSVADARIVARPLQSDKPRDWTLAFRDERGMLAPGKAPGVVFAALQRVFTALKANSAGTLQLENVTVVLPGAVPRTLSFRAAEASSSATALSFAGEGTFESRAWHAAGDAEADAEGTLRNFAANVTSAAGGTGGAGPVSIGATEIRLAGDQAEGDATPSLRLSASLTDTVWDMGARGTLAGRAELQASASGGTNALMIDRLSVATGPSSVEASGRVVPEAGAYAFALESGRIVAAPETSPEEPVTARGTVEGRFDIAGQKLVAERFEVQTPGGNVAGDAAVQFAAGSTPGVRLAIAVPNMPVAEAKQLWPFFAGRGARAWVLGHVRGGTLADSRLSYMVEPGRIGSGQPLRPEELTGEFSIFGTRFDVAGEIPPVGETDGYLTLRGNDVDIALAAGRMTLPSGRTLEASDGRLELRAVNVPPVIGKLDIDVKGDAAAAAELASLEPINAMRRTGIAADDLTGTVSANVKADIPLAKGVPRESLAWKVSAAFDGLSLRKPLEGQTLSDAKGTLVVDRDQAKIDAVGKLNGERAVLDLTEPVRPEGGERRRLVELSLDADGVRRFAPGLTGLLSGPLSVKADVSGPERQVAIDLTKARLELPWIGWSKGTGIGAEAEFAMAKSGEVTRIEDLRISGKTFSLRGSASLDGGGLASARFEQVKLNRDDAIAVSVKRSGKAYQVAVSGKSFDARSLLRMVTGDGQRGGEKGPDVAVTAKLDRVTGFNGESWRDVSVDYRSGGTLSLEGRTAEGDAIAASDRRSGKARELDLSSRDAGSVLRFLDIYPHMVGGSINVALASVGDGPLEGRIDARDFVIADEPRLSSVVSTRAPGSDRSLNEAVNQRIDTSRVRFDRGSAEISKGDGFLRIADGVLRGSAIGSTFQGTLYDKKGNMDMTGTFMPAYGINRLFGELPLVGVILGNGRDRGLIGVTFRLKGKAKSPDLDINPLSAIAPGIFRRIFEYE